MIFSLDLTQLNFVENSDPYMYFQTSGSTINSYLDVLVVSRIIVQLCYSYLWVALRSKGLKHILLSVKDNGFYENSYTLGGHGPPHPPLDPLLLLSKHLPIQLRSVCLCLSLSLVPSTPPVNTWYSMPLLLNAYCLFTICFISCLSVWALLDTFSFVIFFVQEILQGRRKHLKLGGAPHLEGTFFLRKRGHFLKTKRALLCLLQNLGGTYPQCPPGSYVYATLSLSLFLC